MDITPNIQDINLVVSQDGPIDVTVIPAPTDISMPITGVGGLKGDPGTDGADGVTDHGALTGLADDDHTQYALADGSRGAFAATSHTQSASTITDFDIEVSNSTDVAANTAARHTHANSAVLAATTASYTTAEATKLSGIATAATANSTDAVLKARANHTGTQSADTLTDGTTNKAFLATERTKLTGIATGATANLTDATLLSRANHTGTQTASTISDFSTAADARVTAANKKTDSMTTGKLLGRGTAGTGAIEEITLGTNLTLSGTTLNATGSGGGGGDMYVSTYDPAGIAQQVLGTSATQTVTNKNLTSGTNTFPTFNQNTTGTAANVTGTIAIANGGTGVASLPVGILVGSGVTPISALTAPSGSIVGTTDTQTLTNKTLTSPVISSITNTGTLTLPTSTDTLVGRATTDTLTNKTISAPTLSGTVAGTYTLSGTPTFPAAVTQNTTTQTLTNKTIDGASNTLSNIASTAVLGIAKKRQGGSSTDWSVAGTTTYDISASAVKIQTGTVSVNADPTVVTFPEAFSNPPVVVAMATSVTGANVFIRSSATSATTVNLTAITDAGATNTANKAAWIAIGI